MNCCQGGRHGKGGRRDDRPVIKLYCKVCHDSGKSEELYTSHRVKDQTGKVVCPTLLALECNYCYAAGHTVKYCPVLKEKEEMKRKNEAAERTYGSTVRRYNAAVSKQKGAQETRPTNRYQEMDMSSDDEDNAKEEYPALRPGASTRVAESTLDYRSKLMATSSARQTRTQVAATAVAQAEAQVAVVPLSTKLPPGYCSNGVRRGNWADMSDLSGDDEDEDEDEDDIPDDFDWDGYCSDGDRIRNR